MISLIVPTYNEEKFILPFLEFVYCNCDYSYELLLVDGHSEDRTTRIIKSFIDEKGANNIFLFNNPDKYVSFALNIAISKSKYDIIIRMDVHTEYSPDYFTSIINAFNDTCADIVGGPSNTKYYSPIQESIAFCISSPFGMGGGTVHNMNYDGYTNGVTFGAFKKYVFVDNLFNTDLIRNQDDEFFARCNSKGFRIYQCSNIKLYYTPRDKFSTLFRQYYQYGFYKPLALKQVKGSIRIRHIIPSFFVIYLFFCLLYSKFLIIYTLPLLYFSLYNKKRFYVKILNFVSFSIIHISYGIGFLSGTRKIIK